MAIPVTLTVLKKISGISRTPTFKDFAVRKGTGLNLGSSPIERSSAEREALKIDSLRLPSVTLRPSAAEVFSSIFDRN
jgi:hypothetical protein